MSGNGDTVRPTRTTRVVLWTAVTIGLLLCLGGTGIFGEHAAIALPALGGVFVVLGLPGALARASCTPTGITYVNGVRRHVRADEVTEIQVERRGSIGAFPTLVVYRRSGRPLVLRAVADFDTRDGWRRQEVRAARWQTVLRVRPSHAKRRRR